MSEVSFFVDSRMSRQATKFTQMVNLAADEVIMNEDVRFHCPDPKFGKKFMKALERELGRRGELYIEVSKLQQEDNK